MIQSSCRYVLLISFCLLRQSVSLSLKNGVSRRSLIGTLISTSSSTLLPSPGNTVPTNPNVPGIQGSGGSYTRVEGLGGGFDIRTSTTIKGQDVIYPYSMAGLWRCRRIVTSVEGDSGQAELAWKNLGGKGPIKDIESFDIRFLLPPDDLNVQNSYSFNDEVFKGTVLDRGFEMESRNGSSTDWSIERPDVLTYIKDQSDVEIVVVQRKADLPSEKGFGFNELYRVTSSAGGIFGDNKVQRAVRVQRKYRRALDDEGNRIVEGLEIMKTYRVLDGVAGVEMPTSTTKSQLKFRAL